MSEENKNFEEKANETFDNVKETAKETFQEAKEATKEFAVEAKKSANEFSENLKEVTSNGENKKVVAGVLAIVLGSLAIHKFYLGYTKEGILQILLGIFTCGIGSVLGIVEGIIYLTKSDEEFYQTYQVNRRPWL